MDNAEFIEDINAALEERDSDIKRTRQKLLRKLNDDGLDSHALAC